MQICGALLNDWLWKLVGDEHRSASVCITSSSSNFHSQWVLQPGRLILNTVPMYDGSHFLLPFAMHTCAPLRCPNTGMTLATKTLEHTCMYMYYYSVSHKTTSSNQQNIAYKVSYSTSVSSTWRPLLLNSESKFESLSCGLANDLRIDCLIDVFRQHNNNRTPSRTAPITENTVATAMVDVLIDDLLPDEWFSCCTKVT